MRTTIYLIQIIQQTMFFKMAIHLNQNSLILIKLYVLRIILYGTSQGKFNILFSYVLFNYYADN